MARSDYVVFIVLVQKKAGGSLHRLFSQATQHHAYKAWFAVWITA